MLHRLDEIFLEFLHNGACGFSFADGHAEIRKWIDPDSLWACPIFLDLGFS
jgi:prepilin-type processing-associated H-X9-DG protein